jgi:hypothetical protein
LGQMLWGALGWLQLLQKNLLERLPVALVLVDLAMFGVGRQSCVRRLRLRALLVRLLGTATAPVLAIRCCRSG